MIYLAAPWFNKHELDTYHKVLNKLRSQKFRHLCSYGTFNCKC